MTTIATIVLLQEYLGQLNRPDSDDDAIRFLCAEIDRLNETIEWQDKIQEELIWLLEGALPLVCAASNDPKNSPES